MKEPTKGRRSSHRHQRGTRATEVAFHYLQSTSILPASLIRRDRSEAISRMIGTSGPWMNRAELELLADACLFVFAIDDVIDEGHLPLEDLEVRIAQYIKRGSGEPTPEVASDPLSICLGSITDRLRATPLATELWPLWTVRVREMLEAMLAERRRSNAMQASGTKPAPDSYLADGRHSIGVGLVTTAAALLISEPGLIEGAAALRVAEEHFSLAARLANDLRSHEREQLEGKLNLLTLLGDGCEEATRRRIEIELALGRRIIRERPPGTRRTAYFLERFASFLVDLYAIQDFRV